MFFWAMEKRDSRRALWCKIDTECAEGKEIYIIPGGHYDLIDENIHLLSEQLSKCLTAAQRSADSQESREQPSPLAITL